MMRDYKLSKFLRMGGADWREVDNFEALEGDADVYFDRNASVVYRKFVQTQQWAESKCSKACLEETRIYSLGDKHITVKGTYSLFLVPKVPQLCRFASYWRSLLFLMV